MRWVRAGLAYWGCIFALGFLLGTLRVLWLVPRVGLLPATALELPIMLGASWLAAGWLTARFAIRTAREARAMGLFAFVLLMGAELLLAVALAGESPRTWLAGFGQVHAALGLLGQVAFALMPWWHVRGSA